MLRYKGYTGYVQFDDEAHTFHGEVVGIKVVITFQGTTVKKLEQTFKDSIDNYLAWCKKRGKEPENGRPTACTEVWTFLYNAAFQAAKRFLNTT